MTEKRRGRPRKGTTRKVSITLPDSTWNDLWNLCGFDPETGTQEKSLSEILRWLINESVYGRQQ